jgi:hypothetical protein
VLRQTLTRTGEHGFVGNTGQKRASHEDGLTQVRCMNTGKDMQPWSSSWHAFRRAKYERRLGPFSGRFWAAKVALSRADGSSVRGDGISTTPLVV